MKHTKGKLRFDYSIMPGSYGPPLTAEAKERFESEVNAIFKEYIDRINASGGSYNVSYVSQDGARFRGSISTTKEIYDDIYGG